MAGAISAHRFLLSYFGGHGVCEGDEMTETTLVVCMYCFRGKYVTLTNCHTITFFGTLPTPLLDSLTPNIPSQTTVSLSSFLTCF